MIDQEESWFGIGRIETSHIETTRLEDKEDIGAFEFEDLEGMSKDKELVDSIEKDILEVMRKNEAVREKEIDVDEADDNQPGFFQRIGDAEDSISTGVLHGEGKGEIITATLAELYFSQGILEKSIEIYEKLLRQHPDKEE